MPQSENIRRRPDGSIDIDFYRAGAIALRRQAMRGAGVARAVLVKAVAIGLAFGFVGLAGLDARPQTSDAIEIRAGEEQPMAPLRARAEQLRLRLVNATGSSAVH